MENINEGIINKENIEEENTDKGNNTKLLVKGAQFLYAALVLGIVGGVFCVIWGMLREDSVSMARIVAILVGIAVMYAFRVLECGDAKTENFNNARKAQLFCVLLMIVSFLMNHTYVSNLNALYKVFNIVVSVGYAVFGMISSLYLGRGMDLCCREKNERLATMFDIYRIVMIAFCVFFSVFSIIGTIISSKIFQGIGIGAGLAPLIYFYTCLNKFIEIHNEKDKSVKAYTKSTANIWVVGLIVLVMVFGAIIGVKIGLLQTTNSKILDYYERNSSDTVGDSALYPGVKVGAAAASHYEPISTYAELMEITDSHCVVELPVENVVKVEGDIPYIFVIGLDTDTTFHVNNESPLFNSMRYNVGLYVLTMEDGVKVGAGIPDLIYDKLCTEAVDGKITFPLGRIYKDVLAFEDFYFCDLSDIYANGGSQEVFLNYSIGIGRAIADPIRNSNEKVFIIYVDIIALLAIIGYWLFMRNKRYE